MSEIYIQDALDYAETLVGLPYRWFDPEVDVFSGNDKFWCENSRAPTSNEILQQNKSIVCTGLINLMRRRCQLTIPGTGEPIRGKYSDVYRSCPGGTGAWFAYLQQKKRLLKLDMNAQYPIGSLLIARFKGYDKDQGHAAVVWTQADPDRTIQDQLIIHSVPKIKYRDRDQHVDHGEVLIEPFHVSNDLWQYYDTGYYKYVCLPENWLLKD
jgi:hypothetical protein